MRIKRLELNGFKSFMDRVVLDLGDGVTGIVGPNGCGKSNIVDAIRWVIGEQSPKHLRGDAMEDVIFAGNRDHGPMGMAEVSFLLERDEADLARDGSEQEDEGGGLPPVFAGVSEVLVTRRYFRSGESEYFINRAPCRLKDITELFLGTGVGTKAYAIIEQGRIEQIVNAKPQEMRLFIEEAAGVTRFRHRKTAAMRKMERTRDNLLRVQDVLTELERQKGTLERQARRAEEHGRIKEELRALDVRVMATRHRGVTVEIADLLAELALIEDQEIVLQAELRRLEEAIGEGRAHRHDAESRRSVLEGEITDVRVALGEALAQIAAQTARGEEMTQRGTRLQQESAAVETRTGELLADGQRLLFEEERAGEEQGAAAVAHAEAAAALDVLLAAGPPLERAVEQAKDALVASGAEEARVRNTLEAVRLRREELASRRVRLEEEQRVLGERLHASRQAEERSRLRCEQLTTDLDETDQRRAVVAEQRKALMVEIGSGEAAYDQARTSLTQLGSRLQSLHELQSRAEGCTRGVASLLGRQGGDLALLASVLRVPAPLERAVAAALGSKLSHVVVPQSGDALGAVRWLEESAAGSATVVPRDAERRAAVVVPAGRRLLDQIEVGTECWALAEALLGHVLLADDLDRALELWRDCPHAVMVVTPAGQAVDAFGAITGGSEPPLEETLLARLREVRELEIAVAAEQVRVAELGRRLEGLRGQMGQNAADEVALDGDLQRLRMERLGTEKDRERQAGERGRITAQLEVCALDASGLAGTDDQAGVEIEALVQRLSEINGNTEARRSDLGQHQEALAGWREEHAEAERRRTAAAVREASVIERRRAVGGERRRAEAALVEVRERLATLAVAIRETEAAAAAAATAQTDARSRAAGAETRLAELTTERTAIVGTLAELDATMSEEDRAERAGRERLEQVREGRGRRDLAIAERRILIEHLGEQLAERYELGLDALSEAESLEPGEHEQAAARVDQLRRRLVQLGDVNPAAVAELAEVRTRFEFLETQRADLERSLDDLRRTIGRLTRVSRERFDETFAATNDKLEDMFPKLFPGGKARLELVPLEEGDDGDPGVQIVVQPSGKKLQHLSLLSGGEKAMTATALVLSLFLIRPTPFCLLDEVDAPLDEANVGRFIGVVREMAETSQFLLITHNRRTMEMADALYGITMEQPGVSKIVSVRLREAA